MPFAPGRSFALFIPWSVIIAVAPALAAKPPSAGAGVEQRRAEQQRLRTEANRQAMIRDRARRAAEAQAARAAALDTAATAAAGQITSLANQSRASTARSNELARQRSQVSGALRTDAALLARIAPTLRELSNVPVETFATAGGSPEDAVAGLLVLHDLGRRTEEHALQMQREQTRLDGLDAGERVRQAVLDRDRQAQLAQQQDLAARAALAARGQREQAGRARNAASAATAATSAASAIDAELRQLQLRAMAAAAATSTTRSRTTIRPGTSTSPPRPPEAGPNTVPAAGGAPVSGPITVAFGSATEAGPAAGITYATPPGSPVTAPCSGTVEFSGPFRSFGRMLIVNCGHDYRIVMSGLDRLDAATGRAVIRHAPVGRAGSGGIYVQLRHGGETLDPERFLLR